MKCVEISHFFYAGTKDMFKIPDKIQVEIIETLFENGTQILFAETKEHGLIYFTASCITKLSTGPAAN